MIDKKILAKLAPKSVMNNSFIQQQDWISDAVLNQALHTAKFADIMHKFAQVLKIKDYQAGNTSMLICTRLFKWASNGCSDPNDQILKTIQGLYAFVLEWVMQMSGVLLQ